MISCKSLQSDSCPYSSSVNVYRRRASAQGTRHQHRGLSAYGGPSSLEGSCGEIYAREARRGTMQCLVACTFAVKAQHYSLQVHRRHSCAVASRSCLVLLQHLDLREGLQAVIASRRSGQTLFRSRSRASASILTFGDLYPGWLPSRREFHPHRVLP